MADDKLLILVLTAVVPDARRIAVTEEAAVRYVGPPARADEIHPPFKVGISVVRHSRVTVPEAQRVAAICDDVRVKDGDAIRVFHRADRELVVVVASEGVVHGEIRDDHIGGRNVDHRSTPIIRMRRAPVAPKLGVFDPRPLAILSYQRYMTGRDHHLFSIDAVADEDCLVAGVVAGNSVERLLDRLEVAAAVFGNDGCSVAGLLSCWGRREPSNPATYQPSN